VINSASAWVHTTEEGAVRGYAEQKKAQYVGTQRDRGSGAEAQWKYAVLQKPQVRRYVAR